MAEGTFRIVALCGSLRAKSFNRGLLHAAAELAPDGVRVDLVELRGVPEYDEDLERKETPEVVRRINAALARADAMLIATPEYNYGLPGWFKNVLDWVSRPPASTPLRHLPVAVTSASLGERGGARAQMALRASLVFTDTYVLPRPELFVGNAGSKFTDGVLTDETTRQQLRALVQALVDWAHRLRDPARPAAPA